MLKLSYHLEPKYSGLSLEETLQDNLRAHGIHFKRSFLRKLIVLGRVYINTKRIKAPSFKLSGNEYLDLYVDQKQLDDVGLQLKPNEKG